MGAHPQTVPLIPGRSDKHYGLAAVPRRLQDRLTEHSDLVVVLGLVVFLRLLFAALASHQFDEDEFVALLLGRDYAHGAVPYRDFQFFHPPGMLVLLRVLDPAVSAWWPVARLAMMLFDSVTAVCIWKIGSHLYDRRTGLLAALIYSASPVTLGSSGRVLPVVPMTALGILGLTFLVTSDSRRAGIVAGACLGLAIFFKYPAVLFVLPYAAVAPRRVAIWLGACAATVAILIAPFLPEAQNLWQQSVAWQMWQRDSASRAQVVLAVALFWLAFNPLALPAILVQRPPRWLVIGFCSAGLFVIARHTQYHYFLPASAFGSLLAAPLVARIRGLSPRHVLAACILVSVGVARDIDTPIRAWTFASPHSLAEIQPAIHLLQREVKPDEGILADELEYAYLVNRPAVGNYFWNMRDVVGFRYLVSRLVYARAVVATDSDSRTYPAGFLPYLTRRFTRIREGNTTIWLLPRERGSGQAYVP